MFLSMRRLALGLPLLFGALPGSCQATHSDPNRVFTVSLSPADLRAIASAHTLCLVNGGTNADFASNMPAGANGAYNQFYAALQSWPRFQLVDDTAKADLVLTISSAAHSDYDGTTVEDTDKKGRTTGSHVEGSSSFYPSFHLKLFDPGTMTTLWETDAPAGWSSNKKKSAAAFSESIHALLGRLQLLAATADSIATTH